MRTRTASPLLHRRVVVAVCVGGWALLGVGGSASALVITTQHRAPLSNEPTVDADASRLGAIVRAAADFYEDRIGDAHALEVQYYYFDFGPTLNLGGTRLIAEADGRVTRVYLQLAKNPFGSANNWYFDASPHDSSEFGMAVTRVADLSLSQVSDGFRGDVPDTLEVGHMGWATSGGAAGKVDLYTVVLHELGHALGMLSTGSAAQSQTSDGDYDFKTSQLAGRSAAARIVDGEIGHLRPSTTLMWDGYTTGTRRLPSATDFLAIASASNFTQLDLDRKTFGGGSGTHDWTGGMWIGGRSPDAGDDALIGSRNSNPTVRLVGDAAARNLEVRDGDTLDLNGRRLTIGQDLSLGGGAMVRSTATATLHVGDDLRITGGGIAGGGVRLSVGDRFELDNGTSLSLLSLDVSTIEIAGTGTGAVAMGWGSGGSGVASGAALALDIRSATQSDTVTHTGGAVEAWKDATLRLRTAYQPSAGDRVTLMDGLSDAVLFAAVEGVVLSSGLHWALSQAGGLLEAVAALPGDVDLDGDVDFGDAMRFVRAYRASQDAGSVSGLSVGAAAWDQGDFDADGDVDLADALLLANAYGGASASVSWLAPALGYANDSAEAAYLGGAGAVPEPGAMALLVGGFTLGRRARRA